MEIKTLLDSIKQGVHMGVVKPSGGDSILDDQSWSRRSNYGLEILCDHIMILIGLKLRYWWAIKKLMLELARKTIHGVEVYRFKVQLLLRPYHALQQRFLVDTCTLLVLGVSILILYWSRLK